MSIKQSFNQKLSPPLSWLLLGMSAGIGLLAIAIQLRLSATTNPPTNFSRDYMGGSVNDPLGDLATPSNGTAESQEQANTSEVPDGPDNAEAGNNGSESGEVATTDSNATQAPFSGQDALSNQDLETMKKEVLERYADWKRAWESKDIDTFLSFYAPTAHVAEKPKSLDQYRKEKLRVWAKQSYMTINDIEPPQVGAVENDVAAGSFDDPAFSKDGTKMKLTVRQEYDSTTWWDQGIKTLVWQQTDGQWLIIREQFTMEQEHAKN